MDQRRDALLAAAKFIQTVHRIVTQKPGAASGTVGRIQATPGAANVIRERGALPRASGSRSRQDRGALPKHSGESRRIAKESGTEFSFRSGHESARPTHPEIRRLIAESATELGLSSR